MVYGIGIDLVETDRMAKIVGRWGAKFLERVFSAKEVEYCTRHADVAIHYAARFAAKEALLKALGIGLGMGARLKEIEVVRNNMGKPDIVLSGGARAHAEKQKIVRIHLSLTHTKKYATAFVVLEEK